jgi:acyl-CoA thioesterase II
MSHLLIPVERLDDARFVLDVDWSVCVGRGGQGFLFGGAGLAAAILALEAAADRPTIWATAHYLAYAKPGSRVTIHCALPAIGKSITQARATMTGEEGEVLTVVAALGERAGIEDQWSGIAHVKRPEDCSELPHWGDPGTIGGRLRFRIAKGHFGDSGSAAGRAEDGLLLTWVQPREDGMAIDRAMLAVIGDFMTPALRNATGRRIGGNSLDNTIRYGRIVPTEWVLCETRMDMAANGFAHGTMRMFAEDGTLMAVASQSIILRIRD